MKEINTPKPDTKEEKVVLTPPAPTEIKEDKEGNEDKNLQEQDDIDLSELANNAINENFDEILNSKTDVEDIDVVALDEDTKIQTNQPNATDINKENLPIFKETLKNSQESNQTYEKGDIVIHNKYGSGKIVKIIQYDQRQLLQIEFENSGKKLLDPKVADIKKEH